MQSLLEGTERRSVWRGAARNGGIALIFVLLYLGWTLLQRSPGESESHRGSVQPEQPDVLGDGSLRLLQFYASPGVLTEGESGVVCYGVANAKSVRIDPPLDTLTPSLNRCLQIQPEVDTRYTLTAEGADGRTLSASFTVQVKPDPSTEPVILRFAPGGRSEISGKTLYSLCYDARNVEAMKLEPPEVRLGAAIMGCFYVAPQRTTTYKLIAVGTRGRTAEKSVTVRVP